MIQHSCSACVQWPRLADSDLKGAWHYNHVTFTPIAKNFMLYCRLIYMLSLLCVRLTIKVKVRIPESFKVGWYPLKKLGRVTLSDRYLGVKHSSKDTLEFLKLCPCLNLWCFLCIFGRSQAIPASFMTQERVSLVSLGYLWVFIVSLYTTHLLPRGCVISPVIIYFAN